MSSQQNYDPQAPLLVQELVEAELQVRPASGAPGRQGGLRPPRAHAPPRTRLWCGRLEGPPAQRQVAAHTVLPAKANALHRCFPEARGKRHRHCQRVHGDEAAQGPGKFLRDFAREESTATGLVWLERVLG